MRVKIKLDGLVPNVVIIIIYVLVVLVKTGLIYFKSHYMPGRRAHFKTYSNSLKLFIPNTFFKTQQLIFGASLL